MLLLDRKPWWSAPDEPFSPVGKCGVRQLLEQGGKVIPTSIARFSAERDRLLLRLGLAPGLAGLPFLVLEVGISQPQVFECIRPRRLPP